MSENSAVADQLRRDSLKAERAPSLVRKFLVDFVGSKVAVGGACVFVLLALAAIFAPWIAPQNPYDLMQLNIMDGRLPPFSTGMDGNLYLLGTDDQGRDLLSGILFGLRTSLWSASVRP